MDNLNTTYAGISGAILISISLILYLVLSKKTFFNWKLNIIILVPFVAITIVAVYILALYSSAEFIMVVGSLLAAPIIGYSLAMVKAYLNKVRNVREIKTIPDSSKGKK